MEHPAHHKPGLYGDLATMPLKDLISYIGEKKMSGTLLLQKNAIQKQASIREGMIISAGSNQPREYLGQFLINLNLITEDQYAKALATQKATKTLLGRVLVSSGVLQETDLRNALSMKFRETVLEAFEWLTGTFSFLTQELATPGETLSVPLEIALGEIHREGEFRETAWNAIRAIFPHSLMRLEVNEKKASQATNALDQQVLALAREGRTLDEIALGLHATDFYFYQRLYALYRMDLVKPIEANNDTDIVDTPEDDPFSLVSNLDLSDLAEAEVDMGIAGSDDIKDRVPALRVSPTQIRQQPLTAQERYLLSRIDGQRTVGAIVQVSPISEDEALKFMNRFIELGLIALK
jgi:hypothetical protein